MRSEVVPSEVLDVISFTPSFQAKSFADELPNTVGTISKNGLWMWLIQGCTLEVYRTEGKEKRGGYCFRDSSKNPLIITASGEIQSSHISFPCILIALDVDPDGSLLCMFDANALRVGRVLQLPYRITSIEAVSGDGGACMETHQLNPHLRCMFGLVAVGTENGHIFLVDLCLDERYDSDLLSPTKSVYVNKESFSPRKREVAIVKKQHMCMFLNHNSFRGDSFEFRTYSSLIASYPSDDVFVSSLKYIQSLATLAVGFNFDGVQLWNLQLLELQYTIENYGVSLPVVSFAFQEPENDPRHFCYLWIVRGHQQEKPDHTSVATLYSLSYRRRNWISSFGPFYTELQGCTKRFEFPLSADPFTPLLESPTYTSRVVSCQVISHNDASNIFCNNSVSHSESDYGSEEISLCLISWEVYETNGNSLCSSYLLLFDINQWYQAQMPNIFRCSSYELSSYLGVFSLQRVSQKMNMRSLLGVHAIPHSLKKVKCLNVAEEFFYPSSLGFQIWCFSSNCLTQATFFGFQRQLLFELIDDGPKYLCNPSEMFSSFLISGLLSDMPNAYERNVSLTFQREALMQLALENHLPNFFMKCMQEFRFSFSDGGALQDGCSARAIINWVWKKVISIKGSIDKLSQPLFNCSGLDVDKASLKLLHSFKKQLDLINSLLVGYETYAMIRTEQEKQEIVVKKKAISSINSYLQVLLWLHQNRFLPETCEGDDIKETVTYPAYSISRLYSNLRSNLQEIHSSIGSTDILLVDGLVSEADIGQIWQEKGTQDTYPPPSIYAAISLYLVEGISLTQKHMIMYYILLDIMNLLPEKQFYLIPQIKTFLSAFALSLSTAKLTKAFWYLDHQEFESAIKKLLEPGLKASDILPWQHRRIIKSFLFQGEPQKALRYINHIGPPESCLEDRKLHLSVLLARGLITQAFNYQRNMQNSSDSEELFNHFLLGCQETRSLKILMYLPLNTFEVSTMIKFLYDNEDPRSQETLVMYHLLRYNFFEAARVNEKLVSHSKGKDISMWERAPYRNALVESFLDTVSKAEKTLAEELKNIPVENLRTESYPQPLSANVTTSSLRHVTYSDLLNSFLSQAPFEVRSNSDPQTPLRTRAQSCFDSLPFLRPTITPDPKRRTSLFYTPSSVSKRNLSCSVSESTSPVKKSRLLDNSFKVSDSAKDKTPKHLARDIASLLQTPPIHRRSSQNFNRKSSNSGTSTPQSILKKYTRVQVTKEDNPYTARTPSVCSLEQEDSDNEMPLDTNKIAHKVMLDVESHPRQIRFKTPSPARSTPEPAVSSPLPEKSNRSINFSVNFASPILPKSSSTKTATPTNPRTPLRKRVSYESKEVSQGKHFYDKEISQEKSFHDKDTSCRKSFHKKETSRERSVHATDISHDKSFHEKEVLCEEMKTDENYFKEQPKASFNEQSTISAQPARSTESFIVLPQVPLIDPTPSHSQENIVVQPSASLSLNSSQILNDDLVFDETHYELPTLQPGSSWTEVVKMVTDEQNSLSDKSHCEPVLQPKLDIKLVTDEQNLIPDKLDYELPVLQPVYELPVLQPACELPVLQPVSSCSDFKLETDYNNSSSGNSSFCSASERSLIVSPRRPLRFTSSTDASCTENVQTKNSKEQSPTLVTPNVTLSDYKLTESPFSCQKNDQMDSAQRCRDRLDFMSTNSDLYEAKKLIQETNKLLDSPKEPFSQSKKSRTKVNRTYVFSKRTASARTLKTKASNEKISQNEPPDEEILMSSLKNRALEECENETYEKFSQSLKGLTPMGYHFGKSPNSHAPEIMATESSPVFYEAVDTPPKSQFKSPWSVQKTDEFLIPSATEIKSHSVQKEQSTVKKQSYASESILDSSNDKSCTNRRSKKKRVTQKIEFSFAEPNSPTDPEILAALSSPSERPVPTFVFSPPATRARVRQKKLDETMGSSFASIISEKSFNTSKKPPIDPLLQEIMDQSSLDIVKKNDYLSSSQKQKSSSKKNIVRKSTARKSVINLISPFPMSKEVSSLKIGLDSSTNPRHSMVLRQNEKKEKVVKLYRKKTSK